MDTTNGTSSSLLDDLNRLPPSLQWCRDYDTNYRAGLTATFILTGDVRGLTTQGITHRGFLISALASKHKIVILYNRTEGFSFPIVLEDSKKDARALARRLVEQPAPAQSATKVSSLRSQVRENMGGTPTESSDPFSEVTKPLEALRLLEKLLLNEEAKGQVAVVIDHAEHLAPAQSKEVMKDEDRDILITLLHFGLDPRFAKSNNPVFLLSSKLSELHRDLQASESGYRVLEVPLPNREERLAYLQRRRFCQNSEQAASCGILRVIERIFMRSHP